MNYSAAASRNVEQLGEQRFTCEKPNGGLRRVEQNACSPGIVGPALIRHDQSGRFSVTSSGVKHFADSPTRLVGRTVVWDKLGQRVLARGLNKVFETHDVGRIAELTLAGCVFHGAVEQPCNSTIVYVLYFTGEDGSKQRILLTPSEFAETAKFGKRVDVSGNLLTFAQQFEKALIAAGWEQWLAERTMAAEEGMMDLFFIVDRAVSAIPDDPNARLPGQVYVDIKHGLTIMPDGMIRPAQDLSGCSIDEIAASLEDPLAAPLRRLSGLAANSVLLFFSAAGKPFDSASCLIFRAINGPFRRIKEAMNNSPDVCLRVMRLIQFCFSRRERIAACQNNDKWIRDEEMDSIRASELLETIFCWNMPMTARIIKEHVNLVHRLGAMWRTAEEQDKERREKKQPPSQRDPKFTAIFRVFRESRFSLKPRFGQISEALTQMNDDTIYWFHLVKGQTSEGFDTESRFWTSLELGRFDDLRPEDVACMPTPFHRFYELGLERAVKMRAWLEAQNKQTVASQQTQTTFEADEQSWDEGHVALVNENLRVAAERLDEAEMSSQAEDELPMLE